MPKSTEPDIKSVSKNRKAHMRFSILEAYEAGIVLHGYEVKSLREGKVSLEEGLVRIDKGEAYLMNVHIPPYRHLSHVEYEPTRTRKLLLHRGQIDKIDEEIRTKGLALVPLELYFKDGRAKVTVGLAKGKKDQDRREEIKKRDVERDIRRAL
ncbi:MAG: SsrA-binding protein [Elusimicrobia bacterium RIFCSPLOWO2_01_FULL_60_11]|nr:MAG: SsrA-binding protein [Elusimicrobia bacterium RIFCSPLOWO2_01_FULL_60_11]